MTVLSYIRIDFVRLLNALLVLSPHIQVVASCCKMAPKYILNKLQFSTIIEVGLGR